MLITSKHSLLRGRVYTCSKTGVKPSCNLRQDFETILDFWLIYRFFPEPRNSTGKKTVRLGCCALCAFSCPACTAPHPFEQQLPTRLRLPSSELYAPHNAYAAHPQTSDRTRRCCIHMGIFHPNSSANTSFAEGFAKGLIVSLD